MFAIADFEPVQTIDLVRMWRASFEFALGMRDPHPLQKQVRFFQESVLPCHRVRVATLQDGTIAGFMASTDDSINQLYVRVGVHGQYRWRRNALTGRAEAGAAANRASAPARAG